MSAFQFGSSYKIDGAGNDFIALVRRDSLPLDPGAVARLCNRKTGVGADGVLQLCPHPTADFELLYYNADGAQGSLCGNGTRCAAACARRAGLARSAEMQIAIGTQILTCEELEIGQLYRLSMPDCSRPRKTKFGLFLDTGSPHVMVEVQQVDAVDVEVDGAAIRHDALFAPDGTNVNFVQRFAHGEGFKVRTFERGVEAETMACGTGAVAVACALGPQKGRNIEVAIQAQGGELTVRYTPYASGYHSIFLTGPVRFDHEVTTQLAEGLLEGL